MRRLIVGDIHGCYDELVRLVEKAGIDDHDEIIALGDIVDKGPDAVRVFDFFRCRPNARAIKGNHEHKHILVHQGIIRPDPAQQITAGQFDNDQYWQLIETLRALPDFLETKEALLVHGAYEPGHPIGAQKREVLLATRKGEAYLRKRYQRPWYELYDGDKPIVAAHRDHSKKGEPLIIADRVFLLDTGCCYGKRLSGLILPDFKIISVKSRRNYWGLIKQRYQQGTPLEDLFEGRPSKSLRKILNTKKIFREDDPATLLEALGDVEAHIRGAAAEALALTGDRQWRPLIRGHAEDFERLGSSDLPQAVPALIYAMGWREYHVRRWAISGLGHIRVPEVVPQLGRALDHQNSRIRTGAVEALGLRREPQATELLVEALAHQDPEVVTEALSWIANVPRPEVISALETLREFPPLGLSIKLLEEVYQGLIRKTTADKPY